MRPTRIATPPDAAFSVQEIAAAARVRPAAIARLAAAWRIEATGGYFQAAEAVQLVRVARGGPAPSARRPPLTLPAERRRRGALPLAASAALHAAGLACLLVAASLGLLKSNLTEQVIKDTTPIRMVFLQTPGPGGGGGGGGLQMPAPPPPAERKAPAPKPKISSPVPPVRRPPPPAPPVVHDVPPPPPVQPVMRETPPVEIPKAPPPAPAVQAPVVPIPADPIDKPGTLGASTATIASNGPGTGGGVGTGSGPGLGEGHGAGIGPGSGGGTGGGPFAPGNGIEPPSLLREVKPNYTDEARRRAIEGNVVLEVVVRRDGSVGNFHVLHSLGAGLDEKAIDAVRQWRFAPARRLGTPVDVVVEVAVGFKLR